MAIIQENQYYEITLDDSRRYLVYVRTFTDNRLYGVYTDNLNINKFIELITERIKNGNIYNNGNIPISKIVKYKLLSQLDNKEFIEYCNTV